MGAWGTAVFDNDDAADFANEIEDAGTSRRCGSCRIAP